MDLRLYFYATLPEIHIGQTSCPSACKPLFSALICGSIFFAFATALAGLALNQAIVFVATEQFGWGYLPAILIVVTLVPLMTFAASKLWAFAGIA